MCGVTSPLPGHRVCRVSQYRLDAYELAYVAFTLNASLDDVAFVRLRVSRSGQMPKIHARIILIILKHDRDVGG